MPFVHAQGMRVTRRVTRGESSVSYTFYQGLVKLGMGWESRLLSGIDGGVSDVEEGLPEAISMYSKYGRLAGKTSGRVQVFEERKRQAEGVLRGGRNLLSVGWCRRERCLGFVSTSLILSELHRRC